MTRITEDIRGQFVVEITTARSRHTTLAASRESAEAFLRVVEMWCADDQREGRVSGAASLAEPIQ